MSLFYVNLRITKRRNETRETYWRRSTNQISNSLLDSRLNLNSFLWLFQVLSGYLDRWVNWQTLHPCWWLVFWFWWDATFVKQFAHLLLLSGLKRHF